MSTYRQIFYQVVFSTKNRVAAIDETNETELYRYLHSVIKNLHCHLYRINSMPDHLHIFSDLHPSVSLSDFIKTIKLSSSAWIRQTNIFPKFGGWQDGYGAFTYSVREKDMIYAYVKNQKEHHKTETFAVEFKRLLEENGVTFDERYLL